MPVLYLVYPILHQWIILTTDDNRRALASSHLRKRRLDLGEQRIARHDDDNRHVLVDEREWAMLEFSGEDSCGGVSVEDTTE